MITKSWMMFRQMIQQISRDIIYLILLLTPFLAGSVIHFAVPQAEQLLCEYFGKSAMIAPYYYLLDWLISLLPGMMFLFTGGLIILGELDDKIAAYMAVTPAGNSGYLFSRLGYPAIIAFFIDLIVLVLFHLSELVFFDILILSVSSSILGVITALLVIAISSNKVEGMAIGKLSGAIGIGMFVPVLFHERGGYLAGILPSFWIGKYLLEKNIVFLILFFIVSYIWILVLLKKYDRKRI